MECGNIDITCDPAAVCAGYNNARSASYKEIHYYPWRPHTWGAIEDRYKDNWNETIRSHRESFFNACLKGE